MCGRFVITLTPDQVQMFFDTPAPDGYTPSYNVAPTNNILIIPNTEERTGMLAHWGMIAPWAKEPKPHPRYPTINARSETAHEKKTYGGPLRSRRCLIPATGFFEWMKLDGGKVRQPFLFQMESQEPFALAGLWSVWHEGADNAAVSCTMMTTSANPLVRQVHPRMPVILHSKDYEEWLDPGERSNDDLKHLFAPFPPEEMVAFPVSRDVGNPRNDHAKLLEPVDF